MSARMRKKDTDSYSMASRASRNSGGRKTPRFSLRNFFCRRPSTRRSVRSLNSNTELEARSVSSFQPSQNDRDASVSGSSADDVIQGRRGRDSIECPLCLAHHPKDSFPRIMTCHHRSCRECLKQYLRIEITESRVNIACPECSEKFHPNDIRNILEDDALMTKYEEFMLRRILVSDPDTRWCPAPDCGFAVIAAGCASCPRIKCERNGCNTSFCYHCKQYWHPNQTCDAARAERSSNLRSSSVSFSHDSNNHPDIKPCPRCTAFISKLDDGSCNHMTCAVCGAEFCWLCMQEISDLHYLSPSGCTFWGKKPWSRKKKILWQLGILAGAPIGIGLVAGIAVPAMVIGIPVWVGRKLHAKYEFSSKHKRNLIMVGGVTGAVLVSPVLAALAVGIGVPILLAYVYGVVPISLCRSGGCGVTTTNSGGIHFDFDETNDVPGATSNSYNAAGDTHQVETQSYRGANPSIGPSIGEMSLAMTNSLSASGSHIDRVGTLRDEIETDRDSASNRAIAGISLSGSLCGSMGPGPSGYQFHQRRLEVHADVAGSSQDSAANQKRASLSSESANFSLDAKSATVSFGGDDVSTKALAGSLCTRDKDNMSAIIPPLEVHVDLSANSVQYRHNSGTIHTENPPPTKPSSSPTSTRSVNFVGEEIIEYPAPGKRYKKQSLSVGDSIYERAERQDLSCYADDVSVLEPSIRGEPKGLVSPSQVSASCSTQRSPRCSLSMDDMPSHSILSGCAAVGLTEVENDRPSPFSLQRVTRDSTSSEGTSTETVSILQDSSTAGLLHGGAMGASGEIPGDDPSSCSCSSQSSQTRLCGRVSFENDVSSSSSSASSSHALCAKHCESDGSLTSS